MSRRCGARHWFAYYGWPGSSSPVCVRCGDHALLGAVREAEAALARLLVVAHLWDGDQRTLKAALVVVRKLAES